VQEWSPSTKTAAHAQCTADRCLVCSESTSVSTSVRCTTASSSQSSWTYAGALHSAVCACVCSRVLSLMAASTPEASTSEASTPEGPSAQAPRGGITAQMPQAGASVQSSTTHGAACVPMTMRVFWCAAEYTRGAFCMAPGAWCMAPGAWCMAPLAADTSCLVARHGKRSMKSKA